MIYDRDLDGIEDKFDSTFNTPEEVLEKRGIKKPVYIETDEEMLRRLASRTDIPFYVQKVDGEYKIVCEQEYEERVRSAMKPPTQRKAR